MPYDQSTTSALQQLAMLNKQFGDAASPLNNFVSQNTALAVQEQREQQAQINRMDQIRLESQLNSQLQKQQQDAQFKLTQFVHGAENNNQLAVAKFQAQHLDDRAAKEQADKIRFDPEARLVLKDDIANSKDTPDGNRALVASYYKAVADPDVLDKLNSAKAEGIAKEMKSVLGQLSTGFDAGTPQAKQAIQEFLAEPGVIDTLTKKGKMTATEIEDLKRGADPAKIKEKIDKVAETATLLWGTDRTTASNLLTAWNAALQKTGAATSPDQFVQVNYLKALSQAFDTTLPKIQKPEYLKRVSNSFGFGATTPKLPPPPAAAASSESLAPLGVRSPTVQPNQFGAPQEGTNKLGLAATLDLTTPWNRAINRTGIPGGAVSRAGAFAPPQIASDPATEFAVRQRILNSVSENEALKSGLSQGVSNITKMIPFVPNAPVYQSQYTPYQQSQDEQTLDALVRGLYGVK